jgi:hypothetical protein
MREHKIKFVKDGVLFIIISLAILLIFNLIYLKFIEPKKITERKELIYKEFISNLKDRELNYAIFGDSHPDESLNPFYIADSFNFARGGETYIETYYKLKKIVEKDKVKIKNIVLQVDLHTFSEKTGTKDRLFTDLYFYSQIVNLNEIAKLKGKSLISVFLEKNFPVLGNGKEFLQNMLRANAITPIYLGYTPSADIPLKDSYAIAQKAQKVYDDHFSTNGLVIDEQNFHYFIEILKIAKENNMNVIFVKYPLSKAYASEVEKHNLAEKDYYDEIFSAVNKIINKYTVLDYYDIFFDRPEYFYDAEHLTVTASEVFSKKFNEDVRNITVTN